MNILERIPRLIGMIIYACFSVITNNIKALVGSPINDNQSNYLKYFKAESLYYSEDIMNEYFNNNYFGELLRDNLRIKYNLENYLITNDIFKNTNKWEEFLNRKGYFCLYASLGEMLRDSEYFSLYNFTKEIDNMTINCILENTGINESGIKNDINYIIQEITNKYIDFITYKASNITLSQARKLFFGSKDIRKIFVDIQYSFVLYFNTIINAINLDFDKLNISIQSRQNLYSASLFLINIVILIILIITITKEEKYKKLFTYFSEIPKTNNLN